MDLLIFSSVIIGIALFSGFALMACLFSFLTDVFWDPIKDFAKRNWFDILVFANVLVWGHLLWMVIVGMPNDSITVRIPW